MTKSLIKETPPRWKSILDKACSDFERTKNIVVAAELPAAAAAVMRACAYAAGSDEGVQWDATAGDGVTAGDLLEIAEKSLFMQPREEMEKLTAAADAAMKRMRVWHEVFYADPVGMKEMQRIVDRCSARLAERRALEHLKNLRNVPPSLRTLEHFKNLRNAMTAARDSMEENEEFSRHVLEIINAKFPPEAQPEHKEQAKRAKASPRASTPRSGKNRKA